MITLVTRVAGVTYEGRQHALVAMKGNEPLRLVPEPANPYDKNAIAVYATLSNGVESQVGYIPKVLAPRLKGQAARATVYRLTGGYLQRGGSYSSLGLTIKIEYGADPGLLAWSENLADDVANGPMRQDEITWHTFSSDNLDPLEGLTNDAHDREVADWGEREDDDLTEGPGWPGDYGDRP